MGWKASTIFVNPRIDCDYLEILNNLGFTNLTKIDDEPFEVAINPEDSKVYIGTYHDNLIICAPDLPLTFFEDSLSSAEIFLINRFPSSEICSIVLHSAVNLWGYSVTKNGQKIRARAGSADDGTFIDFGEPLEEEKDLLGKSKIDENGNRQYFLDEFPDEPFSDDQVGEDFVFEICSRYLGTQLDRADELLFETTLIGYSYSNSSFVQQNISTDKSQINNEETKPWWKIW